MNLQGLQQTALQKIALQRSTLQALALASREAGSGHLCLLAWMNFRIFRTRREGGKCSASMPLLVTQPLQLQGSSQAQHAQQDQHAQHAKQEEHAQLAQQAEHTQHAQQVQPAGDLAQHSTDLNQIEKPANMTEEDFLVAQALAFMPCVDWANVSPAVQ